MAEPWSLQTFRQRIGHIARKQYFEVKFPMLDNAEVITAMCRNTTLPAVEYETHTAMHRGQEIHYIGKQTFGEWSCEFLCDELHQLRNIFVLWTDIAQNVQKVGLDSGINYKYDGITVSQLSSDMQKVATAVFYGMFPKSISEISFDHGDSGIQTFTVSFAYDYFLMNSLVGDVVPSSEDDIATNTNGSFLGTESLDFHG